MDLQALIQNIQSERLKDSKDALKSLASSETYFQQAYEGRYLFELIQNVRDTNILNGSKGSVYMDLQEGVLTVSNTGAPFSAPGIRSITAIGDSPKDSQEFIGFKGIGFKSVNEVSDCPSVITAWGTVFFDKQRTKALLVDRHFEESEVPLFFIPHYRQERLSSEEIEKGIVTKVILPLKPTVTLQAIEEGFDQIGVHQLVLLGGLEHILFTDGRRQNYFKIADDNSGRMVITKNEKGVSFHKCKPVTKIPIPPDIIDGLEHKERKIYQKEPFVDITLLFDLDESNSLVPNPQSKLYLFYPTEVRSGFNFIIHSYFLVSPDRKTLRDSPLNQFILQQIAGYLSGEFLTWARRHYKRNLLDLLVFSRNLDVPILKHLYDPLVQQLRQQPFIYSRQANRFLNVSEVIIADGSEKGLFPSNQLNGKYLIYIQNLNTRKWLQNELGAACLDPTTIAENIEKECIRQMNRKSFPFFENLYRYLAEHDNLNLKGKKILLTNKSRLLTNEDYVFYGLKERIHFPPAIDRYIYFIHPSIKVIDQRQSRSQTGLVEYSTELLVRKLLRLYEDTKVNRLDILISLLKLNITDRLLSEIHSKVLLPVKGDQWLNTVTTAIYFENDELVSLYPPEKFIDLTQLQNIGILKDALVAVLKKLGVWDIPGLYFSEKEHTVNSTDERYKYIQRAIRNYSTTYFTLYGDWLFDIPLQVTKWFTDSLIRNWTVYTNRIMDENNRSISYHSQYSGKYDTNRIHWVQLSSALNYLRQEPWIKIDNTERVFTVSEVVGIDPNESLQPSSLLLKKYLSTLEIHYNSNLDLIRLLNLPHLDGREIQHFRQVLLLVYKRYHLRKGYDKEFINFYNKILSKLFDYYYQSNGKAPIDELKNSLWLGINEVDQLMEWKPASQLYYIEDKFSYDILPANIKKIVQPHFTNRDKNRFGQIGKRIGLNFKQAIEQKLTNIEEVETKPIWDWFPFFPESLALAETLLDINLDIKLDELKATTVVLCSSFEIELFKDGKWLSTIRDAPFKITRPEHLMIYVQVFESLEKAPYANLLHDLLVELLNRDNQPFRVTLKDFYSHSYKERFIERYEISAERIDDIRLRLKGTGFSKAQSFWLSVLHLLNFPDPTSYFSGHSVHYASILEQLQLKEGLGISLIDYDHIVHEKNLPYLQSLFAALPIDLRAFNEVSDVKVDYRDYFIKQISLLRYSFKNQFQMVLFHYLADKTVDIKSSFQDRVDRYNDMVFDQVSKPLLQLDTAKYFNEHIRATYPYLHFTKEDDEAGIKDLVSRYQANQNTLKKQIGSAKLNRQLLDEFVRINRNRSLLYFDNTIDELLERYQAFSSQLTNDEQETDSMAERLQPYSNPSTLTIEDLLPASIPKVFKEGNHTSGGTGSRVDGSIQNANAAFSGIVAEKMVFEKLKEVCSDVEWVSRNAAKAGANPEGSDSHACDIIYIKDGQQYFVEVKSSVSDNKQFFVSYAEYNKAIKEGANYHFYLVLFSQDNDKRKLLNLKNIFLLEEHQELFHNRFFTANFKNLEIHFQ